MFSSLIDKTIDNIQKQNKKLSYSTYYLNNVTNVKNSFTLIGINAQNLNDAVASFDLGELNYNLTINENQITFTMKEYKYTINGKEYAVSVGERKDGVTSVTVNGET